MKKSGTDKSIIHKLVLFIAAMSTTVSMSAYDFDVDGIYYDKISDTSVEMTHDGNYYDDNGAGYSGNVIIPKTIEINGITYFVCGIGESAFYDCTGLTSITIPGSVTSIGDYAFSGCTGLTSVTIPASVTSIGDGVFSECISLTSINIPEGVASIGDGVFSGCISLTSVNIPEGVISIDDYAFYGCAGLTSVTIPASVTSIGECAFMGCTGLTSVTIPASMTSIGDGTFRGCTGLTYVAIPSSVTSIGVGAFRDCTGMASVSIPASVTSIGDYAFYYCIALNKVICFAETVPTFGYEVFTGIPTTCCVYVPSGTRGSYATADELAFCTIKEFGLTVTPAEVTLEVGATAELTTSYTVDGAAETEKEISSVLGTEFIWSSSAENVATVSTTGQVTAQNTGTVEIKAITRFGNTVFATSTVNVGSSGILDVSADGIKISATPGKIMVENIGENQKVYAYTIDGICQVFRVSNDSTVEITAEAGKIYIIVVNGFATKVLAK